MIADRRVVLLAAVLTSIAWGTCDLWGQQGTEQPSVLNIQHSVTTSKLGFPQFLYMYHLLDGVKSTAEARALTGTISLQNYSSNFSEVLWLLAYWQGECPVDDQSLAGANFIWSDILKNPSQSTLQSSGEPSFPPSLAHDGVHRFCFRRRDVGGRQGYDVGRLGPDVRTVELRGEHGGRSFRRILFWPKLGLRKCDDRRQQRIRELRSPCRPGSWWSCSETSPTVHLMGPTTSGRFRPASRGARSTIFTCSPEAADSLGTTSTARASRSHCRLRLCTVGFRTTPAPGERALEYEIPPDETGRAKLQKRVARIFPAPVTVNAGDCLVVIYGRQGNGATDNETQVKAVLAP